jgi:hypothetical protein
MSIMTAKFGATERGNRRKRPSPPCERGFGGPGKVYSLGIGGVALGFAAALLLRLETPE